MSNSDIKNSFKDDATNTDPAFYPQSITLCFSPSKLYELTSIKVDISDLYIIYKSDLIGFAEAHWTRVIGGLVQKIIPNVKSYSNNASSWIGPSVTNDNIEFQYDSNVNNGDFKIILAGTDGFTTFPLNFSINFYKNKKLLFCVEFNIPANKIVKNVITDIETLITVHSNKLITSEYIDNGINLVLGLIRTNLLTNSSGPLSSENFNTVKATRSMINKIFLIIKSISQNTVSTEQSKTISILFTTVLNYALTSGYAY